MGDVVIAAGLVFLAAALLMLAPSTLDRHRRRSHR